MYPGLVLCRCSTERTRQEDTIKLHRHHPGPGAITTRREEYSTHYRKIMAMSTAGCIMTAMSGMAFAENTWNNYHWARTANPVDLKTVDSVTPEWQSTFEEALAQWEDGEFVQQLRHEQR